MAEAKKTNSPLSIPVNKTLRAHLARLKQTGLYGNKLNDVAQKLIQDEIKRLVLTEELAKLENYAEKSKAQESEEEGSIED